MTKYQLLYIRVAVKKDKQGNECVGKKQAERQIIVNSLPVDPLRYD